MRISVRRRAAAVFIPALAVIWTCETAPANSWEWVASNTDAWDDPTAWAVASGITLSSPPPVKGDNAELGLGNTICVGNLAYYQSNALNALTVDSGETFEQMAPMAAVTVLVGALASGAKYYQSTDLWSDTFIMGQNLGTTALFELDHGTLTAGTQEEIGQSGGGTFKQVGGTNVTSIFRMAVNRGSPQQLEYDLGGGVLQANSYEGIGSGGSATFNQTGGTNSSSSIGLGDTVTGHGIYRLINGAVNTQLIDIGDPGSGTLDQTGGIIQATIWVGAYKGVSAEYDLSGGSATSIGTLSVGGYGGMGVVNQSGGTLIAPSLVLGNGGSGVGSFYQSEVNGTSSVQVNGTLRVGAAGAASPSQYNMTAGTLTAFDADIERGNIEQRGGSSSVTDALTIAMGCSYDLQAGTLSAPLASLTSGRLNVGSQGLGHLYVLQGNGTMQVNAGGQVLFDTAGSKSFGSVDVENAGTVALSATGDAGFQNGAVVNNNAGGLFAIQADLALAGTGTVTFNNNAGAVLRKSVTGGTTAVTGIVVNSAGTVDVQSGTLDLGGGGANSGALNSASGATLKLGGTWALNSGTAFTGTGVTNVYGTVALNAPAAASTDFQLTGALSGSGMLTINNRMDWTGGTLANPLTISPGAALNVVTNPNYPTVVGATINQNGTATTISGGGSMVVNGGSVINNTGS